MQTIEVPSIEDFPSLKETILRDVDRKISEAYMRLEGDHVAMSIQLDRQILVVKPKPR